ncbi:hypothetical protein V6N13_097506 [Hibiscus sabdariffa]
METPPSNDLRLPKKQRRRDENPPDGIASAHLLNKNMDCDSFPPETAIPPVSYKDVVTGGTSIPNDSILFEDDDFDFLGLALVPPSPQLPAEPYGPWMLDEKRRNRLTTTSRTQSCPNDVSLVTQSSPAEHSNPTDEDAAPVFESVARAPIIPPIPESHPVAATSNTNSGAHSKIDGVLRKHNLVVLGSRNLNIMPSKPSVDASSSTSKLNKGLHVQKPLNSERHTTVTLDPVTPLISATRPVPHSKHPSTGSALAGENLMHMDSSNPEPVNMNSGHLAMME